MCDALSGVLRAAPLSGEVPNLVLDLVFPAYAGAVLAPCEGTSALGQSEEVVFFHPIRCQGGAVGVVA